MCKMSFLSIGYLPEAEHFVSVVTRFCVSKAFKMLLVQSRDFVCLRVRKDKKANGRCMTKLCMLRGFSRKVNSLQTWIFAWWTCILIQWTKPLAYTQMNYNLLCRNLWCYFIIFQMKLLPQNAALFSTFWKFLAFSWSVLVLPLCSQQLVFP